MQMREVHRQRASSKVVEEAEESEPALPISRGNIKLERKTHGLISTKAYLKSQLRSLKSRSEKIVKEEISRGSDPSVLARSLAIGLTCGIFPVPITPTIMCAFADVALRYSGRPLSTVAAQMANLLAAPLQILLAVPFLHLGEKIFGDHETPLSPLKFFMLLKSNPWHLQRIIFHAALGWALCAPVVFWGIYAVSYRYLPDKRRIGPSAPTQLLMLLQ